VFSWSSVSYRDKESSAVSLCVFRATFNPSTKRIIFDEASSSQWGIYLSAYNALTKSLNGANTMGNASVTSYAMRFSGANSAAEGFIENSKCCFLEIKSVTSTTSAAIYYTPEVLLTAIYPQGSGYALV
jgi:hypothetical protein